MACGTGSDLCCPPWKNSRYSFTAEWIGVMVFDVVHGTLSGEKWHNTFLPLVGFEPTTSRVVAQTANNFTTREHTTHAHTHSHTCTHTHTLTHTHTEGRFACLESATCPGQFVGILPNGTVKPPANTKTGLHGRFTVSAHSTQSYPTPSSLKVGFKVQIGPLPL